MSWSITVLALAVLVACSGTPALAEHMTLVTPSAEAPGPHVTTEKTPTLDLGVTLGRDGFRLGARLFSALGVYGAWLNGQTRPDGFTVDGRLQQPDRAYNFRLNAEIDAWARRALDPFLSP